MILLYFVDYCLPVRPFSIRHCIVYHYSTYGFWLPLWHLQTFCLCMIQCRFTLFSFLPRPNMISTKRVQYISIKIYQTTYSITCKRMRLYNYIEPVTFIILTSSCHSYGLAWFFYGSLMFQRNVNWNRRCETLLQQK